MKITKSGSLTLALDGDAIPLEKFEQAVASFLDMVESVSREATGNGQKIKWDVSVKSGSALVQVTPKHAKETRDAVRNVFEAIPDGIDALEKGITSLPRLFNESAIKAVQRLASVHDLGGNGLTGVRILG